MRTAAQYQPRIEVGFFDPFLATLAFRLEFGDPDARLPERPAFRLGLEDAHKAVRAKTLQVWRRDKGITERGAAEIAIAARDTIRQAYLDFHGSPLSERQVERKGGSDDQLVGAEGPKLINHIVAVVDGKQVG